MKLQIHCSINDLLLKHIVVTVATVLECLEKEILEGKQRMSKLRSEKKRPESLESAEWGRFQNATKLLSTACLTNLIFFLC